MGILSFFKGGASKDHTQEPQTKGFEVSECSQECDSCSLKFPSSVSIEEDGPLWDSTKPYGMHIVIPTNKSDWKHDALDVPSTLAHAVDKWATSSNYEELGDSSKIKVTVSSLSSLELERNLEYIEGKRGDLLLLPFFVWVRNVTVEDASGVLDLLVPDLIRYRDEHLDTLPVTSYPKYPTTKIELDPNVAYVFMCSHKTRDKRCGVTAPIMKKEMDMHLRDLGMYRDFSDDRPGGVQVAYVNHVGGHKFAANVIIYLRRSGKNIWLARCKPNNCVPIIDECIVKDGRIWPEKVRQIQKFKPIEW